MSTKPETYNLREDARRLGAALGRFFKSLRLFLTAQETLNARVLAAAASGDVARLNKAVAEGGNVNAHSNWRENLPLMEAIRGGSPETVAALLAHGADPNLKSGYISATPMSVAVRQGHPEIVRLLLAAGGKAEGKADLDHTLFAYAVAAKNDAVADMLLAAGARPDVGRNGAYTALFYAVRNGDAPRVRQLLDLGVRTHLRDHDGRSVLDIAAARGHFALRDMIQAHIDAQVPAWQPVDDTSVAHVSILRAQGYRLTEVFNFKTREATLITHNFETGRDSTLVRAFDAVRNKARLAEAQEKLPKAPAPAPAAGK